MTVEQSIIDKLQGALPIDHLEVINESHIHHVPPGSESHFKLVIVSPEFEGKALVARHRLVHDILQDELCDHIHALALHTMTNKQWHERGQSPQSPPCRGGASQS